MKWLRAILTGILLWVLIFFEVSILMFGFNLSGSLYYAIHYLLIVFLVLLCSYIYFKRSFGGVREGFLLGLIFIVTGSILDLIITIPLFVKTLAFFNIYLFVGYLEALVLTILFGLIFRKRQMPSQNLEMLKRQISSQPFSPKVSKVVLSVPRKRARSKKKKR
jgi:hypothetical protein